MLRHLQLLRTTTASALTRSPASHIRAMSSSSNLNPEALKTLYKYGACDISDALLKLKVAGAGFLPDLNSYCTPSLPGDNSSGRVLVAPASTVLFISKSDDGSAYPPSNIPAGRHWVDLTKSETIAVLSQPDGQKNAVLGGIMALRMKKLGAVGVIVHGRIRDVQELKNTEMMIWAKGTSTVGAGAESKPYAIDVPITISGITIEPGDIIFSDPANGVVIIPQSKLEQVLELLPRLVGADDQVKDAVMNGMSVQQAFKEYRSSI